MAKSVRRAPGKSVTQRIAAVLKTFALAHRLINHSQLYRPDGLSTATLHSRQSIADGKAITTGRRYTGATIRRRGILASWRGANRARVHSPSLVLAPRHVELGYANILSNPGHLEVGSRT
jgi:hypothetical protein